MKTAIEYFNPIWKMKFNSESIFMRQDFLDSIEIYKDDAIKEHKAKVKEITDLMIKRFIKTPESKEYYAKLLEEVTV